MNLSEYRNGVNRARRLIVSSKKATSGLSIKKHGVSLSGVPDLTASDLNLICYYCQQFILNGTLGGLVKPVGPVQLVLRKHNLL